MTIGLARGVVSFVVWGALGCGSGGGYTGAGGSGGGAGSAGAGGVGGIGGIDGSPEGCNSVSLGGAPSVTETVTEGTPPSSPTGGTIVGGTYYLVSATFYKMPSCAYEPARPSRRAFLVITSSTDSGRMEVVGTVDAIEARVSLGYTTSGTSISTTPLCTPSGEEVNPQDGGPPTETEGFTATSDQIVVFNASTCGTRIDVLTRQ